MKQRHRVQCLKYLLFGSLYRNSLLTSVLTRELGAKRTVKEAKSQEEEAEKGFTEVTSAQRING